MGIDELVIRYHDMKRSMEKLPRILAKRLALFIAQFRRVKLVRVRISDGEDPVTCDRASLIPYHAKRRRPFAVVLQRKEHICAVELDELLRFVTQSALADD